MNTRSLIILVTLMAIGGGAKAQTAYSVKTFTMSIDGSSSLHDWKSTVGKLEWRGSFTTEGNVLKGFKDIVVTIPVKSIKSTKGKTMDNKTYEAFKWEQNPNIIFKLEDLSKEDDGITARGTLMMAGTSKPITMKIEGRVLYGTDIEVRGSYKLNMRDFSMDPPTAVMGTIKVREEVTVNFDLTLIPTKK